MQGGTDVATPLTTKRPLVYDVRSNFAPELEAESALSKGLVILTSDELGWLVERSITTYMTDDNPAYSEVSSWESLQTSVRLLRGDLQSRVGVKLTGAQIKTVIGLARTNLDEQVKNGVLKAYQNISFEDMGDGLGLAYDAAPVEPLNFVVVTVNAVRISAI